jgi:hypothetical protein
VKIPESLVREQLKKVPNSFKLYGADVSFIEKVKHLVLFHEIGGDEETNLLRDADSISFFEDNLEYYFETFGSEKTDFKIKYMYDRVSNKAKDIVNGFEYKNSALNKLFRQASGLR